MGDALSHMWKEELRDLEEAKARWPHIRTEADLTEFSEAFLLRRAKIKTDFEAAQKALWAMNREEDLYLALLKEVRRREGK